MHIIYFSPHMARQNHFTSCFCLHPTALVTMLAQLRASALKRKATTTPSLPRKLSTAAKELKTSVLDKIGVEINDAKASNDGRLPHKFMDGMLENYSKVAPWLTCSMINSHLSRKKKKESVTEATCSDTATSTTTNPATTIAT